MAALHVWALVGILFTVFLWKWVVPNKYSSSVTIGKFTATLLFGLALVIRILLAANTTGFGADISCFSAWADRMVTLGPAAFYAKDYFSDYPPLYLYVLWGIGLLKKWFAVETFSAAHLVLLKLPAILADLGIGYLLYRICRKHLGLLSALALTAIYLFQPVVLLDSCLWGQIDSLFTFFLLLVCYFLEGDRLFPAYLVYGAGVLLKPQMLIFAPLLIVHTLQYIFLGGFSSNRLLKVTGYGSLAILLTLLAASPFGLEKVIGQYTDTLASYPYASVNAYNFWSGVGLNWRSQDTLFFGLPCTAWGSLVIVLAVIFCIVIGYRFRRIPGKYPLMGAFLIITMFTFSVRMHERYLYPMMGLLLISFPSFAAGQLSKQALGKPKKGALLTLSFSLRIGYTGLFTAMTCLHFYNTAHVLYHYNPADYSPNAPILRLTGIGMTICAILFYVLLFRLSREREGIWIPAASSTPAPKTAAPDIPLPQRLITRWDLLLIALISLLYAAFALRDLGSLQAPDTVYELSKGQTLTFEFPEEGVSSLSYYIAPEHNRTFQCLLTCRIDPASEPCYLSEEYTLKNVFTWNTIDFPAQTQTLSMTLQQDGAHIVELVFLDAAKNPIRPLNADSYPELFDETELYPDYFSFRNSMYFDEIYHARTAYEFLHGERSYENTHPPFGKILIALGVLLFGMNPFGWRIIGTLTGILMLPVLYLFAKRLTGHTGTAALTCWIFAFDFMHFSQTRIATIDVYIVFFIICMYYFLYLFFTEDYWSQKPAKTLFLPLALCGVSMGFGIASKWTGVYAGMGMGILFFAYLKTKYDAYLNAKKKPSGKTGALSNRDLSALFPVRTTRIICFCLIFFVLVPGLIYLLSYLPFRDGNGSGLFARMLKNQQTMYSYHSKLNATHYFASPFYEWPLIVRPIWYYSGKPAATLREGISSFGNPLVWWVGIPAFFYTAYLFLKKKDKTALFLLVGYLAQYVPWFFVTRITFIYHYFPSMVFVVLMIGYGFRNLTRNLSRKKTAALLLLYGGAVFALFLLFYPVLAGQPVEIDFAEKYLKWFDTWVLVAPKG